MFTLDFSPLPQEGYIRLPKVLATIPVSRTTWYDGIKSGIFPKPTKKFGSSISVWDVKDIRALLESP
jgi:predicted DNA-binding transcriptional regulator AlpA